MLYLEQARLRSILFAFCLSILPSASHGAENLGILGSHPKWGVLEKYQETITHDEFAHLIQDVYCTHGFSPDLIKIDNDSAQILTTRDPQKFFTLRVAKDAGRADAGSRPWRIEVRKTFADRESSKPARSHCRA